MCSVVVAVCVCVKLQAYTSYYYSFPLQMTLLAACGLSMVLLGGAWLGSNLNANNNQLMAGPAAEHRAFIAELAQLRMESAHHARLNPYTNSFAKVDLVAEKVAEQGGFTTTSEISALYLQIANYSFLNNMVSLDLDNLTTDTFSLIDAYNSLVSYVTIAASLIHDQNVSIQALGYEIDNLNHEVTVLSITTPPYTPPAYSMPPVAPVY